MSVENEGRRDALKIIGAIGTTCAFPFESNELYGQPAPVTPPQQVHQHPGPPQRPVALPGSVKPGYFSESDFAVVSLIADLIIPKTATPGAVDAGVPGYIDSVVGANKQLQEIFRAGLALLSGFAGRPKNEQVALLTEWGKLAESGNTREAGPRFFQAMKNLTADGYYTSYAGLVEELGYKGNTVLDHFPESTIAEH